MSLAASIQREKMEAAARCSLALLPSIQREKKEPAVARTAASIHPKREEGNSLAHLPPAHSGIPRERMKAIKTGFLRRKIVFGDFEK